MAVGECREVGRRCMLRDALSELKAAVVMGAQMVRDVVRLELEARGWHGVN